MLKVERINHAIIVELPCPECGKTGLLFLSKKHDMSNRKILRIYHGGNYCYVEKSALDSLLSEVLHVGSSQGINQY